jgi:phosphonate degradation associated HDIG domain protein
MTIVDEIIQLFEERGNGLYFGEQVTETEHALQAAHLAREAGASNDMILGALLHDIGHLLHGHGEDIADHGVDAKHEDEGAEFLAGKFPALVIDCVRLHVPAKRYLCAVEPEYLAGLSPVSQRSLELQGGPMTAHEVAEFEAEPHFREAVQARRWDDQAKIVGLDVPGVASYRSLLEASVIE